MRKINLLLIGVLLLFTSCNLFAQGTNKFYETYSDVSICYHILNASEVEVTYDDDKTDLADGTYKTYRDVTSVTIPATVTHGGTTYNVVAVSDYAFHSASSLVTVVMPNSVLTIGNSAFAACRNLTNITLSDNLKQIGSNAFCCGSFYNPSSVTITFPSSVTSIPDYAFSGWSSTTTDISLVFPGTVPPIIGTQVFYGRTNLHIAVPCGSLADYINAWSSAVSNIADIISEFFPSVVTENKNISVSDCNCGFPSTITIKDGASLSASNYSSLASVLSGITVNLEKELTIGRWNMIGNLSNTNSTYSMLLNNAGDNSSRAHAFAIRQFDYTNNDWGNYLLYTSNTPENYGAFFVWPFENLYEDGSTENTDATVTLTQEITSVNTGNIIFTATNNNSDKWFALSNPYIGRLNLNSFYTTNTSNIQGTKVYVWDVNQQDVNMSSVTGDWQEVTISSGTPALYPATGFLIAGKNASTIFNFTTSQILTGDATATYKTRETDKEIVFSVLSNGIIKKAYSQLDEQANNGFDDRDSYILFSSNEDAVNPYFAVEGKNLLDNRFNTLPYTANLNFNAYKSNAVEFVLSKTDEELELTLIDLANENKETVLAVDEPILINVTTGQNEGRYQLRFSKKNVGINEIAGEEPSIQIWNNASEVTINGKNLKRVEIYNTLGQRVYSASLAGDSTTFDSKLNKGAYIIKAYTNANCKSEKVIIR